MPMISKDDFIAAILAAFTDNGAAEADIEGLATAIAEAVHAQILGVEVNSPTDGVLTATDPDA